MLELDRIRRAAAQLADRLGFIPDRAIVLGSGLGRFTERLKDTKSVSYAEVMGFPKPTVAGHRGEFVGGVLPNGARVLALAGRYHYYEGYDLSMVVFPTRVLAMAGVKHLVLTNAAGGVNPGFAPGDLMLITDHVNFTAQNPLRGENIAELGPRFPDMTYAYDPKAQDVARAAARAAGLTLREGVYAWLNGPSYETPAEIRMLRGMGVDAVGMSTVPETLVAVHAGLKVAGVSLITNMAAGTLPQPLSHQEVIECANSAALRFETLAEGLLMGLGQTP